MSSLVTNDDDDSEDRLLRQEYVFEYLFRRVNDNSQQAVIDCHKMMFYVDLFSRQESIKFGATGFIQGSPCVGADGPLWPLAPQHPSHVRQTIVEESDRWIDAVFGILYNEEKHCMSAHVDEMLRVNKALADAERNTILDTRAFRQHPLQQEELAVFAQVMKLYDDLLPFIDDGLDHVNCGVKRPDYIDEAVYSRILAEGVERRNQQ